MEILIVANKVPYPPKDGGAYATLNMAMGLAQAGANVTVLAMSTPKHFIEKKDIPLGILNRFEIEIQYVDTTISQVKVLKNLIFSKKPYNAERFNNVEFEKLVKKVLLKKRFDIVQLEGPYLAPYINVIRKYHSGKVSLRAHNVEWEIWKRSAQNEMNLIKRWYLNILSKRIYQYEQDIIKQIDILVPISEKDKENLVALGYNGPIQICPVGYELSLTNKKVTDSDYPTVFHLGGLDWTPNQEGIIWFLDKCWPSILHQIPTVTFHIAGRNAPKKFIEQIKAYPNVHFHGEVNSSIDFINSKSIMVVPLLSGSGMRVKIVEGMALGKAIVSTLIGAEGINAEDGKQIALANNATQFADKVKELLYDEQKIKKMGIEAKAFVEKNLDNNNLTQNLFDFYCKFI